MNLKRGVPFILVLLLILSWGAGCRQSSVTPSSPAAGASEEPSATPTGRPVTEVWTSAGSSVCAWFSGDGAEDSMGINTDPLTMRVGKTAEGKEIFSLLRLPMRGTWFGDEISSARLYLKIAEGQAPSSLCIGWIEDVWSGSFTTLADAQMLWDPAVTGTAAVRDESDGWVSLDITDYVVGWLNGDRPNYGMVLFGEKSGEQTAFSSDWDGESQDPPRLEVTGALGNRGLAYGKFAYMRHPERESDDASLAEHETANCLSYALRDIHRIDAADLGLNYDEMTRICRESGEDAVVDYCAERVMDYVERHKSGLKISSLRKIDGYSAEIDPGEEYRIALRVGCHLYDDEDVLDEVVGNFDFHLWAQIDSGQWAQKFMFDPTEIVPCTPPGGSPARYPWDASLTWGNDKFTGFYTSKTVYFAVAKDVGGFTEHKSESSDIPGPLSSG